MSRFEPVKTAVIGAGGRNIATGCHLPATESSEIVELVALCDISVEVEAYAAKYGVNAYRDYDAMLRDDDIEMVQVATPDWCHAEHAIKALEAGKHVLLQKPMCTSFEELERLRAVKEQTGLHLQVAQSERRRRPFVLMRELLQGGEIGELRHFESVNTGRRWPQRNPESLYLTTQLGSVWRHNGMHDLDLAAMYVGALPVAVQAIINRNPEGEPEYLGVAENFVLAKVDFANGLTGSLEMNSMLTREALPTSTSIRLIGTEGEMRGGWGVTDIVIKRRDEEESRRVELPPAEEDDWQQAFRSLIEDFAWTIRDNRTREPRFELSCSIMGILLSALESARHMEA